MSAEHFPGASPDRAASGVGRQHGDVATPTTRLRLPGQAVAVLPIATPYWLRAVGFIAWVCAVGYVWRAVDFQAYGDTLARELITRRVTDSLTPGLAQLGTVWLPLPSLVLIPFAAIDPLWNLGIIGALVGGLYLQIAIGALYRIGYLIGGAAVGCLAAIVFIANPNTLYHFTLPLTEAPALAFGCLSAAGLAEVVAGFRQGEMRLGAVLTAALGASAMLLCRYDGWMFAVVVGALLAFASLIWLRSWQRTEALAIFYAIAPITAIGLWLLYNWLIFGDPLSFQRGPNASATQIRDLAARGLIPAIDGRPIEAGHPLAAIATYGRAVVENMGLIPVILAVAGVIFTLARVHRRPAGLVLIALATPLVFYTLALNGGQAVIVTRAFNPEGLWNIRYGGALAPVIALGVAALAGVTRKYTVPVAIPLALLTIVSGTLLFTPALGPVTIAEGRLQYRAQTAASGRDAARWLAQQPDTGLILLDESLEPQTHALMIYANRPLRRYVTSASPQYWESALSQPGDDIALIVALKPASGGFPNDRVAKALVNEGGIAGFTPAFENDEMTIFARADRSVVASVPATAAGIRPISTLSGLLSRLVGPLGIALTLAVLALFVFREAIPATPGARLRRGRVGLTIVLAPLLVILLSSLALRLVTIAAPVFALEFAATETAQGAAVPTATAAQPTAAATPLVAPAETATAAPAIATAPPPLPTAIVAAPTAVARSPQQIATAVGALQSGQFETRITYTNNTSSTSLLRFDLGDGQRPARLYSQTTFQGATGGRTTERIVIGTQTWTRVTGEGWVGGATAQPVRDEVVALLPDPKTILGATRADVANSLRWYDTTRDANTRLETHPITGIPQEMRQTTRGTGTVLTAIYRGWNTAVTIMPPIGQ